MDTHMEDLTEYIGRLVERKQSVMSDFNTFSNKHENDIKKIDDEMKDYEDRIQALIINTKMDEEFKDSCNKNFGLTYTVSCGCNGLYGIFNSYSEARRVAEIKNMYDHDCYCHDYTVETHTINYHKKSDIMKSYLRTC